MKKEVGYLYRNIKVCSAHFETEMFATSSKKNLKNTAVPTLFNIPNPPARIGVKRRHLLRDGATDGTSK